MRTQYFNESELAALAKQSRERVGKSKSESARELGVHRATISLAEDRPKQSLTKLRIRIIEKYSKSKVIGPVYFLEKE
jgi:DNA-binding XRE family transcriptional regulator